MLLLCLGHSVPFGIWEFTGAYPTPKDRCLLLVCSMELGGSSIYGSSSRAPYLSQNGLGWMEA